jgi:putative ABC transport system permease protein
MNLKAALRSFRHRRAITALIICTLTLGIGVVTAIFMVAQSILLRPLPYANADSVAMIWRKPLNRPSVLAGFRDAAEVDRQIATGEMVRQWRERKSIFADVAAIESWRGNMMSAQPDLVTGDGAVRLRGALATPNFFDVLGVSPTLGRLFNADDTDVVVISDGFWHRQFGGDAAIIGRKIDLTLGRPRTRTAFVIAGVLPPAFRFTYPEETEIWMVLPWATVAKRDARALLYQTVARLNTGISTEQASTELATTHAADQDARKVPATRRETLWAEPIREYTVGRVRPAIQLLAVLCASVLLIGCISAANLTLAQSTTRERELITQRFLGASRRRLLVQLLFETLMLVVVSTGLAVVIVAALQPIVRSAVPLATPRANEIAISFGVVIAASLIGGTVVLLAGLLPAWMAVRPELRAGMLQPNTMTTGHAGTRLRQALITLEVAFVTPLALAAGLFLHSFWNLQHVDLGFESENIVVAELRLLHPRYRDDEQLRLFELSVIDRAKAIGGVVNATITSAIPMRGVDWLRGIPKPDADWVKGAPTLETTRMAANERQVEPNYFAVMQITLVEGRLFDVTDSKAAAPVAVVSSTLARALFPDGTAVGQMLPISPPRQIVGIVRDVRAQRVDTEGTPAFYTPRAQSSSELVCLVVKTDGSNDSVKAAIGTAIRTIDPEQPVQDIRTLDQVVADTIDSPRVYAVVAATLALITLALALAGVCGVLFQVVSERTRELGIRAALGAAPKQLVMTVLGRGLSPLIAGIVLGTIGSVWLGRLVQQFLFDVKPTEPATYAATAAIILICGLVACYVPGRRAARLDTMAALRHE